MKKVISIFILFLLTSSILSGCTLSSQKAWAKWQKTAEIDNEKQVKAWEEDLNYLVSNLEKKHKNLYHTISKEDFYNEEMKLRDSLSDLSDIGRFIEIKKLVAKIEDGHTSIRYDIPLNWFPVDLYSFDDGLFVTAASKEYEELLGKKLIRIGGTDIEQVFETMKVMISRDNEIQLKNEFPFIVKCADFLNYYGYVDNISEGNFTFEDADGKEMNIKLKSYYHKNGVEKIYLEEKNGLSDKLLYSQNLNEPYWYKYLEGEKAIYFNYNRCEENKDKPVKEFTNELISFIDKNEVEKFIFDIRNNGGGSSNVIEPLIDALSKNEKINKKGSLYVVIGNSTYSSAILNAIALKNKTNAIMIGQPTGGRPNHYGEVKAFNLPNTGLRVQYSTKYFQYSSEDTESIFPDINVENTFIDYSNGIDPVIRVILAKK